MKIASENKAKLTILAADGKTELEAPIEVQFNPENYSKSWNVEWMAFGKTLQWTKTTPGDFTLILPFDSYEEQEKEQKDVTQKTAKIKRLLDPSKENKPTACRFQWGKVVFIGVVKGLKEEFTLFQPNGIPVRSVLTLTLQPWPGANLT